MGRARYWFAGPQVEVDIPPGIPVKDLAPFLDALRETYPDVGTRHRPGGGGPVSPETYIPIILFLFNPYFQGLLMRAAERHYDALHEQMARLISRIWRDSTADLAPEDVGKTRLSPLAIGHGNITFHFLGEVSKEELSEQLLAAAEKVEELPKDLAYPDPEEESEKALSLFWDSNSKRWTEKPPSG